MAQRVVSWHVRVMAILYNNIEYNTQKHVDLIRLFQ